jgi:hypothetical protein
MDGRTEESTREYRVYFNDDACVWEDPIPPGISSNVLARRMTSMINRTSLLAWSLMNIPSVEVADLTEGGWIHVRISTGPEYDEEPFKAEVLDIIARVKQVRGSCRRPVKRLDDRSFAPAARTLKRLLPGATETSPQLSV